MLCCAVLKNHQHLRKINQHLRKINQHHRRINWHLRVTEPGLCFDPTINQYLSLEQDRHVLRVAVKGRIELPDTIRVLVGAIDQSLAVWGDQE